MEGKERLFTLIRRIRALQIPMRSAYAGYFLILALFPGLLLLLSLLSLTGLQVESLISLLQGLLPGALAQPVEEIVFGAWQNRSGTVAGISALAALWSAGKGVYGLHAGMNAVYGVEENRGYFLTRLLCGAYALAFLAVMVLTLLLHVFGERVLEVLLAVDHPVVIFLTDILSSRVLLLGALQTLLFTLMYWVLPNRRGSFFRCVPGGVFSALGWLGFTDVYSIYIEWFSGYRNIYGSVYALALGMLWLYCCISILLYGAVLNRLLERKL